jgi:hypothetical protein
MFFTGGNLSFANRGVRRGRWAVALAALAAARRSLTHGRALVELSPMTDVRVTSRPAAMNRSALPTALAAPRAAARRSSTHGRALVELSSSTRRLMIFGLAANGQ